MSTVSLIFVGLLIICPFHDAASFESGRGSIQLMNMMSTVSEVSPFKFTSYGNWCGKGGEGEVKDALDQCCFVHDACYDKLIEGDCKGTVVYLTSYDWKFPFQSETKQAECVAGQGACQTGLCTCDLDFAKCIGKNKDVYNEEYQGSIWGR